MNTIRDWHGDIEEFIDAKQGEEKKAWALIEQGYDGSYNGDAYGSVMYQKRTCRCASAMSSCRPRTTAATGGRAL
ncbi:MAG: hypothetical protein CM1200mP34_0970 [Verrucomicrobiales bacterium]|nr:MAG: hypothetical protein CM1200mP34_0970 [Verrucomicrobiales bacterium]